MKVLTNCCKALINKKETFVCSNCGKLLCGKHSYKYVDENNSAITKHSKDLCEKCFTDKYATWLI